MTQIEREPMPYGRVLIVDDVATNLYIARGLMAPYKLKIDVADSGSATLKKISSGETYDIIFMDHLMPDMDGVETTKRMREAGYDLPVVALTANVEPDQAEFFLANGFDDFISKPVDVAQLDVILKKYVRDGRSS